MTANESPPTSVRTNVLHLAPTARRSIVAAFVQNFVDLFDTYLPTLALASAIGYFQPAGLSKSTSFTIYYSVFVLSLLGRPIGSTLIGRFADRLGRRKAIVYAMVGYTILTFLTAFLPGFSTWGYAALALLLILRFLNGILLGGGVTSAGTLAIEASPKSWRGFVGGLVASPFTIAIWLIGLVTGLELGSMAPADYTIWGWRIPFLLAGVFSIIALLYFVRRVPESHLWVQAVHSGARSAHPLKDLLSSKTNRASIVQTFILMTGYWLTVDLIVSTIPAALKGMGFSPRQVSNAEMIAYIPLFFAYLGFGVLSQLIGRRRSFVLSGALTVTIVPLIYYVMLALHTSFPLTVIIVAVMLILTIGLTAPSQGAYLNERFSTDVRAVGYGLSYTWALVIPGFYSFYLEALGGVMPYKYAQVPLVAFAGLLIVVGAVLGPETKDRDLRFQHDADVQRPN